MKQKTYLILAKLILSLTLISGVTFQNTYPDNHLFSVGDTIEIKSTITDPENISQANITITYPNGTIQTLTLTNQTSNLYNTSFTTPELAGEYNITFWANDSAGNTNTTQTSFVNDITDPTQISGLRAWYDAGDNSTLYTDESCTTPVSSAEQNIRCWQDKSSYAANATNVSGKGTPTYSPNIFNGRSVVNFSKSDQDTLRHTLSSQYTSDFTIFVVIQSKGNASTYDSFFSNGEPADTNHFQIDYTSDSDAFRYGASTKFNFQNYSNDIKLYAVTHDGNNVKLYNEGSEVNSGSTTEGRVFEHYRINQNRNGNQHHNSYIGEIVLYDKVLSDCELEQVDIFLGDKYGRDFFGLRDNYGHSAPHNNDINGIGEFSSKCSSTREFTSAQSSIITISSPTSLDLNDSLTFAHDNGDIALITDTPSGYNNRINRTWRLDEDNEIGNVDISFDISDLNLQTEELEFALLNDTDTTFSNANIANDSGTLSGNTITFSGINPTHGEYLTLAIKDSTSPQLNTTSPTNNFEYNTSTTIEISANIYDGSSIDTQYINITLPNSTIEQYTLTNQTNNKYNISYTIPKLIGQFKITFFTNDTYGNENTSDIYFTTTFQDPLSIADLQRWYDASDNQTLFTDASCTTQVSADQDSVNCWLDKSNNKINATVFSGHSAAKFESSTGELINGKTKLRFNHTSSTIYETNLDIRATTLEDVSIFTVYRPKSTTKNSGGSGQALWGNDDGNWDRFFYSLFDYSAGLGTDGVDDGLISLGGASSGLAIDGAGIVDDLFLLTAIYDGEVTAGTNTGPTNASQIYFDGNLQTAFTDESDDTAAKTQMYIGWDGDNSQYDGDLAEIIIYGRVMSACEIETINNYLGEKYGKDFVGINDNYDLGSPYNNDVNGVGKLPSDCTPIPLISPSTSDILTISNPSSVEVNDTLTFGHNNAGLTENSDAINSSYTRLNQTWRADIDGDSDGVGTVTLEFDLSLNSTLLEYTTFVLLNDSDGDFSNASIINNSGTISGNKITFTNANLQTGDYFTIGFYDTINPKVIPTSPTNNSEHQTNSTIEISANITDNIEIDSAKINLTYPNGTIQTIILTNQTNNKYNTSITPTLLGDYIITFIANDSTGNTNSTEQLTIQIYGAPKISFENPTPTNNSIQNQNFIPINISSSKNKGEDHYTFVNFDNSLLMWLRMDETNSSGHPTDSSGNGNNGSLVGNAFTNSTGRFGNALHLDGDGDYANLPASNSLIENTGAWTISLWLNTKSIASADLGNRILTIRNASGLSATAFALGGENKLQFFYRDTSGTGTTQNITTISTNTWYHYAVTYNGTTSKIYINGQLNHTNSESIVGASSDTARIGASPTASAQFFNGSLDEILILNHELTSQEILSLYNATENQYETNTSTLSDGTHTFTGYSVGVHGLKNQTETRTVTIDTTPPQITNLNATPETSYNLTETITISLNITDNIEIDSYNLNITLPNSTTIQQTLTKQGTFYNTTFQTPSLIGTYTIKAIANDTAGNTNSTETTTFEIQNSIPTQTSIQINSGSDITLSSGTTKQILGTTRLTDLNGHNHISNLTGYFYLTETGESQNTNKSTMYKTTCTKDSIISTTIADYNCTFDISHYAIATDSSANKSGTSWTFKTSPLDQENTGTNATTTTEINSLLSFNITPSIIDFGNLTLGENTTNSNKIINITNLGNTPFDITLSGNDLSCDIGGVEVEFIEYGKNPFSYGVGIDMLESTVELDLDAKTGTESDETPLKTTYYGIGIPGNSVKGSCSGNIVLSAVSDVTND